MEPLPPSAEIREDPPQASERGPVERRSEPPVAQAEAGAAGFEAIAAPNHPAAPASAGATRLFVTAKTPSQSPRGMAPELSIMRHARYNPGLSPAMA